VVERNELGEFVVMRVKQLVELEHQTSALQRCGFAPSRERGFAAATAVATFSCVCERHAGRHSALRRIEYLAETPARASGALTVDEMTLARARARRLDASSFLI
jgi:hypothetical protein